jgi:hypothetical protein
MRNVISDRQQHIIFMKQHPDINREELEWYADTSFFNMPGNLHTTFAGWADGAPGPFSAIPLIQRG